MASPQRDNLIEELRKADILLGYAVLLGEEEEVERLRKKHLELASLGDMVDRRRSAEYV